MAFLKEICNARKEAKELVSNAEVEAKNLVKQAESMLAEQMETAEKEANEKMKKDLLKAEEDCKQIEKAILLEYEAVCADKMENAKRNIDSAAAYLIEKSKNII